MKKKTKQKQNSNLMLIFLGAFLILMIISYFIIGWLLTAFLGVGILVIVGFAHLLDKVKNKPKQKKILNIIIIIILSLGILVMLLGIAFLAYVVIKAPKFDVSQLNEKEPSILYDINGNEFERLGTEMREKVTYDELPEVLVDAIVATEDSRFFQHNGFDAPRFLKASLGQLVGHSDAGGASTLSMQVIKNSFTSADDHGIKGIVRKFTDIYLSVFKLEKNYTKEQIIEFYVNNHNLGGNIYGVKQAALAYFNKDIGDLNLAEASIIAGMFKAPNLYKPTNTDNIKSVTRRRNTVLYLMERHGYITSEERQMATSIPVESLVDYNVSAQNGLSKYQGYIDTVVDECIEKYKADPYTVSMKVYTNLDRSKQDGVDKVMNGESYTWANDTIQSGVSVLDSATGKILAIGAGRNKKGAKELNLATSDEIKRQPGSTAKPLFDYGPLIEYNNASTYGYNNNGNYKLFIDEPYSYTNGKSINNWDGTFMGAISMRKALSLSRNIPALKAFQQVDNKKIIEFVQNLGIEPEIENGKIHEAHALGAFTGVNSLQMAAAYAAFSNGGYYNEPYSVSKVIFRDTGEEKKHEGVRRQAMSDSTAYMITSILDDVTLIGSGNLDKVAMKTGTTNFDEKTRKTLGMSDDAIRDSWTIGYTTKTVIGMWYGYTSATKELVSQGLYCHNLKCSTQKDKLFAALAKEVFEKNKEEFKMPSSVVKLGIVAGSNPAKIAGAGYSGAITYEYFKKGSEPTSTQTTEENLAAPTNLKAVYNSNNNTVSLSWNAVTPPSSTSSYGTFGYNVYFNNTLLGFTSNTSFTVTNQSNPYGTYKVIAAYKSYDGIRSNAATYELKKTSSTLRVTYTPISTTSYNVSDITRYVTVTENGNNVTSKTSNWKLTSIMGPGGASLSATTLSTPGAYTLRYEFTYDGEKKETGNITVTINANNSGNGSGSGSGTDSGGENNKDNETIE